MRLEGILLNCFLLFLSIVSQDNGGVVHTLHLHHPSHQFEGVRRSILQQRRPHLLRTNYDCERHRRQKSNLVEQLERQQLPRWRTFHIVLRASTQRLCPAPVHHIFVHVVHYLLCVEEHQEGLDSKFGIAKGVLPRGVFLPIAAMRIFCPDKILCIFTNNIGRPLREPADRAGEHSVSQGRR